MTDNPQIMILQTTTGPVQIKDASREQLINALEAIVWELNQLRQDKAKSHPWPSHLKPARENPYDQ